MASRCSFQPPRWAMMLAGLAVCMAASAADPAATESTAALVERLGLEESKAPVRERAGWRKPQNVPSWRL